MTEIFEVDLKGNAGCTIAEIPTISYSTDVKSQHGLMILEEQLSLKVKLKNGSVHEFDLVERYERVEEYIDMVTGDEDGISRRWVKLGKPR